MLFGYGFSDPAGCLVEIMVEKTLQATGNMVYPMLFQLSGAISNIILDPIFIFGYFGFPAMGVAGAAIATVAGQMISLVFSLIVLFVKSHQVRIVLKGFRFDGRTIRDIYAVGLPSIVMQAIGSVMNMGMNAILAAFSDTAVAVLGAYYKLQSFVFMPVFGLNQGVMPVLGYNYGARNRKRFTSAMKIGSVIALLIMALGTLLFWVMPEQLLDIFKEAGQQSADPELLVAHNWEEFLEIANSGNGFIKAMWCGDDACENKIKDLTGIKSRCIPFEEEQISDVCVCCGKPAKKMLYWGRQY